jgi:hypothetical protein
VIISRPLHWNPARFSLRSLFILMTVCCLAFGLWSLYVAPYRQQLESRSVVNRLKGQLIPAMAEGPGWQRWLVTTLLGKDAFVRIVNVNLSNQPVDDDALRSLAGLCFLESLSLDHTNVTHKSLETLRAMPRLRELSLKYTNVSDRGAQQLGSLRNLQDLILTGTKISDASIDLLAQDLQLKTIYIRWTQISDSGAQRLRRALPNCKVYHHALADVAEKLPNP